MSAARTQYVMTLVKEADKFDGRPSLIDSGYDGRKAIRAAAMSRLRCAWNEGLIFRV